jgi:hypothetical protein
MRRKLLVHFACALAVGLSSAVAAGQDAAPRAQGKLVVQVEYFKGAPPAFEPVPGSAWYGRFATQGTPQPRSAADTVLAVDVKTRLEGERVVIKVGVHVGERQFDRLEEVGTYYAAVGEKVAAADLEGVGVVPFIFKVLRVNDADTAAPTVSNKTQSIEAVITEFTPTPLPRAKLTLRNLSSKRVRAVYLRQVLNGRERVSSYAAERGGKTIMEPGGTYERDIGITTGQSSRADFTPEAIDSIVVVTAVFDDYTYEGEAEPAASKRALDEGERVQLARLVALVREARAAAAAARGAETPEAVRVFKSKLAAIGYDAPPTSVDAIVKSYPELGPGARENAKIAIEVSMHAVRRELLDDLEGFERKFLSAPAENSFKDWLKAKQDRFEQWLARL